MCSAGDRVGSVWFEEADMEDVVNLHGGREFEAISVGANFCCDSERADEAVAELGGGAFDA